MVRAEEDSSSYILMLLAESVYQNLEDKKWAEKVYIKAEDTAENSDDLQSLAESVREYLGDKK